MSLTGKGTFLKWYRCPEERFFSLLIIFGALEFRALSSGCDEWWCTMSRSKVFLIIFGPWRSGDYSGAMTGDAQCPEERFFSLFWGPWRSGHYMSAMIGDAQCPGERFFSIILGTLKIRALHRVRWFVTHKVHYSSLAECTYRKTVHRFFPREEYFSVVIVLFVIKLKLKLDIDN